MWTYGAGYGAQFRLCALDSSLIAEAEGEADQGASSMDVWVGNRSSRMARAAGAAAVLLVIFHIIAFGGSCDARPSSARAYQYLTDFSKLSEGSWRSNTGADAAASPHPLDITKGVRYRPPIINMRNFGGPVSFPARHALHVTNQDRVLSCPFDSAHKHHQSPLTSM